MGCYCNTNFHGSKDFVVRSTLNFAFLRNVLMARSLVISKGDRSFTLIIIRRGDEYMNFYRCWKIVSFYFSYNNIFILLITISFVVSAIGRVKRSRKKRFKGKSKRKAWNEFQLRRIYRDLGYGRANIGIYTRIYIYIYFFFCKMNGLRLFPVATIAKFFFTRMYI